MQQHQQINQNYNQGQYQGQVQNPSNDQQQYQQNQGFNQQNQSQYQQNQGANQFQGQNHTYMQAQNQNRDSSSLTQQYQDPNLASNSGQEQYYPQNNQNYNTSQNFVQNSEQMNTQVQYRPPPLTQQQYTAYPEYDRQSQPSLRSFQNHSLGGWNDPPKVEVNADAIRGVSSPETKIVSILTTIIDIVKKRLGDTRIVGDTENRIDVLFERLAGSKFDDGLLSLLYEFCQCLEVKDFITCSSKLTAMMTSTSNETKWLLGLKRLLDMYQR